MYTYDKKVNVSEKMKKSPLFQQRIKGMNFGFLSKRGYYERDEVKKQPALMKEMGVKPNAFARTGISQTAVVRIKVAIVAPYKTKL